MKVAVVIPALDEETSIGLVLASLPAGLASEVIVVDNGSRDATASVARAAGARVVPEPRRGYGQACLTGIAAAPTADVYAFLDADLSDYPEQLGSVLEPIAAGRADLVIGSRKLGRSAPGAHPWHAVLGTRLCVGMMNGLIGTRATDLGPFRAITGPALARLEMCDRNFGWTVEMQVKAAQRGLRVVEVPVDYRPRIGRSKVSGTFLGSVRAGAKILWTIARYALASPALPRSVGATMGAAALVISLAVAYWAIHGDVTDRVPTHLAVYGAAFIAYLAALSVAERLPHRYVTAALALSVMWRAALVPAAPLLSDDIFRYVWEGRIQNRGGNPYAPEDRPDAPHWTALRDAVWEGVNHKDYTAIYPPFWQLCARAVAAISDSVIAMKVFLVGCEMATWAVLMGLLDRRRLPRGRLLVLAFSPLALVEIAGSGHNDALGLLLLSVALLALDGGRLTWSAVALGLGFASKLLPGLVGLAWVRRFRARDIAVAVLTVALLAWPFASAGGGLFGSLRRYEAHWRFNESLFAVVHALVGDQVTAQHITAGLLAVVALTLAWRRTEVVGAALGVCAAALLLSANVLPWYALWLLPLLVLRDCPPALLFTGTVSLAYLVYPDWRAGGPWHVGWGIRALEYLPCVIVAAIWVWRRLRAARAR